ncbi:MAG: hypothetical protein HYV09_09290 [Deltaproteobacteria bacterium]|nr:hypothetical protein [Deltaproteobacteria bacterium]
MRSFRSLISAALLVLGAAFVFQACSKQGEAQRCEKANGNDDCEPPLICTGVEGIDEPICCPENTASATTSECRGARGGPTDAGGTDTGATDTATAETAPDTATGETAADTGAAEAATDIGTDTASTDAAAD